MIGPRNAQEGNMSNEVERLNNLITKAAAAGNATLLNRILDEALPDNALCVVRGINNRWELTDMGEPIYGADFTTIRSKAVEQIQTWTDAVEAGLAA
jgi:hypothetical protein